MLFEGYCTNLVSKFRQPHEILRFWNLTFSKMDFILATFLREHKDNGPWWYYIKIVLTAPTTTTNDALLPLDECPGVFSFSKLLGITMKELWDVLIECKLAKKHGDNLHIKKDAIKNFIITHGLDDIVEVDVTDKQPVLRIGRYTTTSTNVDHSPVLQWKSGKRPPRHHRDVTKKFREDWNNAIPKEPKAKRERAITK
jgi:hypothetical protein